MTLSHPTIVVLAVRCDVRYTAEEYAIYREIVRLWGDGHLKDSLIVAFTFGDLQDNPLEEELKTVCPELKTVLGDALGTWIRFDKVSERGIRRARERGGGGGEGRKDEERERGREGWREREAGRERERGWEGERGRERERERERGGVAAAERVCEYGVCVRGV